MGEPLRQQGRRAITISWLRLRMSRFAMNSQVDVVIVGGCGHVGLPLGIAFADRGLNVALVDVNPAAVATVNAGELPFAEPDARGMLHGALEAGRIRATTNPATVGDAENVVIVIGTPIDEHLNPDLNAVQEAVGELAEQIVAGQL